jgi:3-methyladenine DNA glycosylase AlkC
MSKKEKNPPQLKYMYNSDTLSELAGFIKLYYKKFNVQEFLSNFKTKSWKEAELKARVRIITISLYDNLPKDYEKALNILIPASFHIKWHYFGIFFPDYVECYGLNDWKLSMKALQEFTQSSSGEFAIRPFIELDQDRAFKKLLKWSKNRNHHIRRLASEGCRPRIPWGSKLQSLVADPSPIIPILENLKNDPELYVRKSVANNLNDISKDNPELVLRIARAWHGKSEHADWIVKHGLRTLLKKGDRNALQIFGHESAKGLKVNKLKLSSKSIMIGDKLEFSFELENTHKKPLKVRLEYAIYYAKKSKLDSRKVFQIGKLDMEPSKQLFKKSQSFKDFSTRKHLAGEHKIGILVNGEELDVALFRLRE